MERNRFSVREDMLIKQYKAMGYSYKDIGEKMDRDYISLIKRDSYLRRKKNESSNIIREFN